MHNKKSKPFSFFSKNTLDKNIIESFNKETIENTNRLLMYVNILGIFTLLILSTYDFLIIDNNSILIKLSIVKFAFLITTTSFIIYYFKRKTTSKFTHSINALSYILFLLIETIILKNDTQQIFHISISLIIINISLFIIFKLKTPIAFIFSLFTMAIFNINFLNLPEIGIYNIGIRDINIWFALITFGSWIINIYMNTERVNAFIINHHLKQAQLTKYKLFGVVSHDLKNIIASQYSLTSYLSSSRDNIKPEDAYKMLDIIHNSSKDALNVFEELMVWIKSQMNAIKPTVKNINITELIEFQVNQMSNIANEKKLTIEFDNSTLNNIKSDSTILGLVLRNLLTNAIKFSQEGSKIEINTFTDCSNYCIEVKDYGVGISPELINELVLEEKLITTLGTNGEKGTGLGLSLSKTLMSQINGEIHLSSNGNKGTSAKIYFNPNSLLEKSDDPKKANKLK